MTLQLTEAVLAPPSVVEKALQMATARAKRAAAPVSAETLPPDSTKEDTRVSVGAADTEADAEAPSNGEAAVEAEADAPTESEAAVDDEADAGTAEGEGVAVTLAELVKESVGVTEGEKLVEGVGEGVAVGVGGGQTTRRRTWFPASATRMAPVVSTATAEGALKATLVPAPSFHPAEPFPATV